MTNPALDLLLLVTSLSQVKSRETVIALFVEGMNKLYPELDLIWAERVPSDRRSHVEVCTRNETYGFLVYSGGGGPDESMEVLIHNAGQMLGIILDKLRQDHLLRERNEALEMFARERARTTEELEARVAQRTAELGKLNKSLADSRLAALNMMEDAIASRKHAEETAANLQREIAERERAEEELRKLALVVQHSFELVNLASLDGKMIFLNEVGSRMLGISPRDVDQYFVLDFIPENLQGLAKDKLLPALMDKGRWEGDLQYRNIQTGELTDVHAMTFTIQDVKTGAPLFLANVSHDITDRKRAEAEQEKLRAQLVQAQKMEVVGRLAGGVAHDFNNLLTVINGHSRMLLDRLPPDHPLHAQLVEIRDAGDRAARLTQQLLAFSRRQMLRPRVINLNDVVKETEKILQRLIGEDIHLTVSLDPSLGNVKADPDQISQILMNLAVNARDAMPQGGRLTLETANIQLDEGHPAVAGGLPAGPCVQMTVSDSGVGIDKETQEHIFEPFFTTKPHGSGTGLGLSTVYGIVKQSSGWISVYSEPGLGTSFKIYLPCVDATSEEREHAVEASVASSGEETILVVEDQENVRHVAVALVKRFGYQVLEAASGEEALAVAASHPEKIHLVLTDVVMPGMSGRVLAEKLVAVRPDIRILYMSGYTDDVIVQHGVLENNVAYLQKPFTLNDLASKIREVLVAPG